MLQSRGRYLLLFLGVQLVVMALLYREGYRKRVAYFLGIFYKGGTSAILGNLHNVSLPGDVYANLSLIARPLLPAEELPYCPETSPFLGKGSRSQGFCIFCLCGKKIRFRFCPRILFLTRPHR